LGADVEDLKFFERRDNQRVGLGTGVDDVNRRGVLQDPAEQGEQGGLALLSVAKLVGTDDIGVPAGKGVMPVVEVGPVPGNAVKVQPGGAEFNLETLAEIAFGLGIEMNASGDVHNTIKGLLRVRSSAAGRRKGRSCGVDASMDFRSAVSGVGGDCVSQCGFLDRRTKRR